MDSKIRDLLRAALEKTQAKNQGLRWQAFGSEAFRTQIGTGYLHIQRATVTDAYGDIQTKLVYSIQVSNTLGQVVAEAEATEGSSDPDFLLLQELFTAARTAGLGGYQVIEDMLHELRAAPSHP